jgi:hypothetical protein
MVKDSAETSFEEKETILPLRMMVSFSSKLVSAESLTMLLDGPTIESVPA